MFILATALLYSLTAHSFSGGEGTLVGGNSKLMNEYLTLAKENGYQISIPTIKVKKQRVPITYLCQEEEIVRTFQEGDAIPSYVELEKIETPVFLEHKDFSRVNQTISLIKKIYIDGGAIYINADSRIDSFQYITPDCESGY